MEGGQRGKKSLKEGTLWVDLAISDCLIKHEFEKFVFSDDLVGIDVQILPVLIKLSF